MDCKGFAEEDESVLPRDEDMIVKPVSDAPLDKAMTQPGGSDAQQAVYKVINMITRSKIKARTVQAKTAPPQRSGCLATATEAAMQKLIPPLESDVTARAPKMAAGQTADAKQPKHDVICDGPGKRIE